MDGGFDTQILDAAQAGGLTQTKNPCRKEREIMNMRGCYTRSKKDFCLRNKTFMIFLIENPGEPFKVNAWLRVGSLKLKWKWTGKVGRGEILTWPYTTST